MAIKVKVGDLLNAQEQYIVHQTSSITSGIISGIAKDIFDRFPYANYYIGQTVYQAPGTIVIRGNGIDKRFVVNLNGQMYSGGPSNPLDATSHRESYFRSGLLRLADLHNLQSIAFPFKCGCGLAQGDWIKYRAMIEGFAEKIGKGVKVGIYQRKGDLL
jgi:O-acetyl-ADP-ribose deacetylase (regulator of RNase III)